MAASANGCTHFVGAHVIVVTRVPVARAVALHENVLGRDAVNLDEPVRRKP